MTIVYVHGGVSGLVKSDIADLERFVRAGAEQGSALDAVETAIRGLEDDPLFNAGYGSVLNIEGGLEMDAGIVHGPSGRVAGVANVTVRNPISLARKALEETPHVLLTGPGAQALGRAMEQLPDTSPEERERWATARAEGTLHSAKYGAPEHVDTVGAVVLDDDGVLAAGSSTGGVFAKLPGRVGDAPIFGAGLYASAAAAVVGTGVGEVFLETLAAFQAGELIERGEDPQRACEEVITALGRRAPVPAGLLALDGSGRPGAAYRGGSWAVAGPAGPVVAVRLD